MRRSRSAPASPRCSGSRPSRTGRRQGGRATAAPPSSPNSRAFPSTAAWPRSTRRSRSRPRHVPASPAATARIARTELITFSCHDASQSASVNSSNRADVGAADVVHEAVDAPEPLESLRRPRCCGPSGFDRSAVHVQRLPRRRRRVRDVTTRAPSAASSRAVTRPIPRGRAGDDADFVAKPEIHGG